jgi:hydroxymethylglutaryl-CoA lyase
VVYLSMGFGNPYGDPYNEEILLQWAAEMVKKEVQVLSLADTVGLATPAQISLALTTLIPAYPDVEFGVHLHSTRNNRQEKLEAAWTAGCRRFDGALRGIGGCPMAQDDLVGNMDTEAMIDFFSGKGIVQPLDTGALQQSCGLADRIFI